MSYSLPAEERVYLRELAKRQAEIAALPVMQVRKKIWTDMNDCVPGARPPFAIETDSFDRDFLPDTMLRCTTDFGRWLEKDFLRNIRRYELVGDDHVCPDTLETGWHVWCDEYGVEIPTEYIKDIEGVVTGYHFDCPVKDLNDGLCGVKPAVFGLNRESTMAQKAFLEDTFGDILPVALRGNGFGAHCLTQRLMRIMSMETFFLAMYDCPDALHGVMAMLRDNAKRMALWAEAEGLLTLNNGNQCTCGTCYNFTTKLPREPIPQGGSVRLGDMWGVMDSQETVGVSPELFHEFCFPYYSDLASLFGFVYWGCCEPADPIWETSLSKLPNLRAVSISRWANQQYMAEALAGRDIIFSRKPDPNLLGVYRDLDEAAWRTEIRTTLDIVTRHNLPHQFIVRDVYSLKGNLPKVRRATEIANEEIDRFYGSCEH